MKFGLFFVGVMIVLAGCATEQRITMRVDGSSLESTNTSLRQMSESLSAQDRCKLQAAILRIQLGDAGTWKAGSAEQKAQSDPLGTMLNGMSFQQIVDLSQRYPDKAGTSSSCQN